MENINILICSNIIQEVTMQQLFDIEQMNIDLCIVLGNSVEEYIENIRFCLNENVQTLYVLGSNDELKVWNKENAQHIHGFMEAYKFNGIKFTGFMGSPKIKENVNGYTQEESILLCNKLPAADVFITHDAGYQTMKNWEYYDSPGYKGILEYEDKYHPKYHIFGHYFKTDEFYYPEKEKSLFRRRKNVQYTKEICVSGCALLNYSTGELKQLF